MSVQERQAGWKARLAAIDRRFVENPRARQRLGVAVIATLSPGLLALFGHMPAPAEVQSNNTSMESKGAESSHIVYSRSFHDLVSKPTATQSSTALQMPMLPTEPIPGAKLEPRDGPDLTAVQTYINTSIVPLLTDASLSLVEPINRDAHEINLPNQFIATEDGIYGTQFTISTVVGGDKNVSSSMYGEVSLLRDGKVVSEGANSDELCRQGKLCHGESAQLIGHTFTPTPEGAEEALKYIIETTREVAKKMAAREDLTEASPTPS